MAKYLDKDGLSTLVNTIKDGREITVGTTTKKVGVVERLASGVHKFNVYKSDNIDEFVEDVDNHYTEIDGGVITTKNNILGDLTFVVINDDVAIKDSEGTIIHRLSDKISTLDFDHLSNKLSIFIDEDGEFIMPNINGNFKVYNNNNNDVYTEVDGGSISLINVQQGDYLVTNIGKDITITGEGGTTHSLSKKLNCPSSWSDISDLNNTANVNSLFATTTGLDIITGDMYNRSEIEFAADPEDKIMIIAPNNLATSFRSTVTLANGNTSSLYAFDFGTWYTFESLAKNDAVANDGIIKLSFGVDVDNDALSENCKIYIKKHIFM